MAGGLIITAGDNPQVTVTNGNDFSNITLTLNTGEFDADSVQWKQRAISIPTHTNTVSSVYFSGELKDIIHINGVPYQWAANGSAIGDVTKSGNTLNFSAMGGISGWLIVEYRNLA